MLLVVADPLECRRFGSWLQAHRFDVLLCPGPGEPDYTCIGSRGNVRCALAAGASIVVLDMSLDSEAVMLGTDADDLLTCT